MQHIIKVRELNEQNDAELREIRKQHEKVVTELRKKCDVECDRLREQMNDKLMSSISLSVNAASSDHQNNVAAAVAAAGVASDTLFTRKKELNELKLETDMLEKQIEALQF